MAYHFKLEALRRYRRFQEEQSQKELSEANRMLEQAEHCLSDHIALRDQTEEEFRRRLTDGSAAPHVAMYRNYLQRLDEEIALRRRNLQTAVKICDEKRNALLEAMQKRKTLDRLKEKGEQAFLADLDSAEQAFINEMALSRFTRNST